MKNQIIKSKYGLPGKTASSRIPNTKKISIGIISSIIFFLEAKCVLIRVINVYVNKKA